MDHSILDLVLVEGFKHEAVPKIILFRSNAGHSLSELTLDNHVIAVASDIQLDLKVPLVNLNDTDSLVSFIETWLAAQ